MREVREVVFTTEGWVTHRESVPDKLSALIDWLVAKSATIPDYYLEEAKCDIRSETEYEDGCRTVIEIYYYRPMTEEEIAREAERDRKTEAANRDRELRMLAELKRKYESFDTEAEAVEAAKRGS